MTVDSVIFYDLNTIWSFDHFLGFFHGFQGLFWFAIDCGFLLIGFRCRATWLALEVVFNLTQFFAVRLGQEQQCKEESNDGYGSKEPLDSIGAAKEGRQSSVENKRKKIVC